MREILEQICKEDNINNISFNQYSFTIDFGDILNTETLTGNTYVLLGSYVEVPYSFESNKILFHRAIINEFETRSEEYLYSGFVHYNGKFCYGGSGIDYLCNSIRDEGLTSDNFNMFLIKFYTYLSISSHATMDSYGSGYKKLDLELEENINYTIKEVCTINEVKYPLYLEKETENKTVSKINYSKPYIEVLADVPTKKFSYKGEIIIPKIVRHESDIVVETTTELERVNVNQILNNIKDEQINKTLYKINNKPKITIQDLLHKFKDKFSRMDGSIHI